MSRRPAQRTATRRGASPAKRKAASRRPKRPSLLDQAVAALPFSQATLQKIATWGMVGTAAAVALGIALWLGLPGMAGVAASQVVGEAGLRVDEIQIDGLKRMDRMTVYQQALDQDSRAMPLVDLALVRERLLKYPWIQDAQVSRKLPNTLRINIIEREPAAIWQSNGQLMLVDPSGVLLEPVSRESMPDLPLLIGDGANAQEPARAKLLDEAPALKPLVKAATWIGNRRWDLIFDTGEKLQLPEGEIEAASALRKFADLDAKQRLLGKGTIKFDMRVAGNMVMQRPAAASAPLVAGETGE
ncbi:cell division protein FtsQ/DivIB [Sphingomonas sp. M1-B02]|uniref:cell division protein FtsQ/DivIB n=1 Tax=Sphingomonas sp. M1-B02 TaxID=3114300 RepID=UPI0022409055|nr:cell division protein FtsQ/DivIB [Sphingomonas sp. S6-11]UZK67383.1 FtsQ-type POTRA domain-containing protein [Sphingomonas sp. S6-11]